MPTRVLYIMFLYIIYLVILYFGLWKAAEGGKGRVHGTPAHLENLGNGVVMMNTSFREHIWRYTYLFHREPIANQTEGIRY